MAQLKSTVVQGALTVTGNAVASKIIKNGGTSDQILMADGSTSSKSEILGLINAAVVLKGTLGTGGTITSLPTAAVGNLGYAYKVITAGTYASQAAKVGDMFICWQSGTSSYAWMLIPSGDDIEDTWRPIQLSGTQILANGNTTNALNFIPGTNVGITNSNGSLTFTATDTTYGADRGISLVSGKFGHSNTAITATTSAGFYKFKYDAYGHITGTTAVTKADLTGLGVLGELPYRLKSYCASPGVAKADDATEQGFYYVQAGDAKKPSFKQVDTNTSSNTGNDYHVFTTAAYSADWLHQLGFDCRSNDLFVRRKQNGVWQPWTSIVKFQPCTGTNGNTMGTITDNAVPRWDTTRNTTLQNSGVTIDDSNNLSTPGSISTAGLTSSSTVYVTGTTGHREGIRISPYGELSSIWWNATGTQDYTTGQMWGITAYTPSYTGGDAKKNTFRFRGPTSSTDTSATDQMWINTSGLVSSRGGFEHAGLTAASGKTRNDYILLAGGGTKAISDFATSGSLGSYLPLAGGTLTGTLGFKSTHLIKPVADYISTTSSVSGAITINLPASIGNTMVSLWIDVYNYVEDTSFSVHVGGYTYSNSTWEHRPSAMVYGANHKVRLGHNGTNFVIYIGELNSSWAYPQISVRNVILGYGGTYANWYKDWTINFTTDSFKGTKVIEKSDKVWTTRNDGASSGLDADLLDGQQGSYYLNYNNLTNKPTIPTVNNATLTIQKNGTSVATFTANASSNVTANITVPTKTSDLTNDSGFWTGTKYWANVAVSGSSSTATTPSVQKLGITGSTTATANAAVTMEYDSSYKALKFVFA